MKQSSPQSKGTPWTRDHKIGVASLVLTVLGIVLALIQPEARRFIGIDRFLSLTQQVTNTTPQVFSTSTVVAGINGTRVGTNITPQASSTSSVAVGINGTWVGTDNHSLMQTFFLTRTGNLITGTGFDHHGADTFSETIRGSISGNSVYLTVYIIKTDCDEDYTLTLSQNGQSLAGYYLGCNGVSPTIDLAKQ